MGSRALVVLAKAPVPGRAKTRLRPALSEAECAGVAEAMARDVLLRSWPFPRRVLAVTGGEHEIWGEASDAGWTVIEQHGPHLGARMWNAVVEAGASQTVVLGTDSPHLPTERVAEVAAALERADAAWIPAEDGGYVCIGTGPGGEPLFGALPWGTASVRARSREVAVRAGLTFSEIGEWFDLDEIADLERLWVHSGASEALAAHTLRELAPVAQRLDWAQISSPLE